ncbi:MAG TPA: D-arabinono-1,4-lactone oxidase, partial [Acidimicrobiales bacterium]|nr:D-arabinono-1,4-lactone oxidase [Acidimicrobiales bacterium]
MNQWRNWAGNQVCAPALVEHPSDVSALAQIVKSAAAAGSTVKVIGAGHSFTDIACTTGTQVVLDRYTSVVSADVGAGLVTVQAGITLGTLNEALDSLGLAFANLGDIAYQTVSGALSTGTHGTGAKLGALSTFVEAMEIVTGDGSIMQCSRSENAEVFAAARVGLGALGLVSTVTLRCVPAFTLHAVNEPMRLDDVLAALDEHVAGNDHFEFNWFPHTEWVQAKQNNRVEQEPESRARAKEWFDEVFLENVALKAAWRVGRRFPSTIPGISRQLTRAITRVESTEKSYKVFTTPRLVRFYEIEYGLPRAAVVDCVHELRSFIDASGLQIQVPVEVRFVAGDDIPLSMASGRDSAFVACHVFQGRGYEQYFRGVERIMAAAGGRPHWG